MAPRNSRFRQVNPAFAAAHGLAAASSSSSEDGIVLEIAAPSSSSSFNKPYNPGSAASASVIATGSCQKRIEQAIAQARSTGKLNASNLGLSKSKLPDELFDLRKGIKIDLSLASSSNSNNHGSHAESTLTLVDFSDNPLGNNGGSNNSSNVNNNTNNEDHQTNDLLEKRILCYEAVQIMRLRRCELQSFHVNWNSLEQLKLLDLSGNSLSEFSINHLPPTLLQLNLSSNQLVNFGVTKGEDEGIRMVQLEYLNDLDLSQNKLTKLPTSRMLQCRKLQTFRCSHNQITQLSLKDNKDENENDNDSAGGFLLACKESLQVLDLSYNKLSNTTGGGGGYDFSIFSSLQMLHLAENLLTSPPTIPPSLTQLALGRNKLKSIQGLLVLKNNDESSSSSSSSTTEEYSLIDLLLADNQLTILDAKILQPLKKLQRLDVNCNLLKNLPYELGFLPQLQLVSVSGNPLVSFKSSDLLNTQALLSKLRKRAPSSTTTTKPTAAATSQLLSSTLAQNSKILILSKMNLNEFPQELVNELVTLPDLTSGIVRCIVDYNMLQTIPDLLLTALPSLNTLNVNHNRLTQLPSNLGHSSLVELSLSRNGLKSDVVESVLFDGGGRGGTSLAISKTLQILDLSSNRLEHFPCFGSQFPSLRTLSLAANRMKSISHWTFLPSTISSIDLSENVISDIGEFPLIIKATSPSLNTLLLGRNDLKSIPPTLGLLDMLLHFDVKGNPQRLVRPAILEKSGPDVVTYLKNRLTPEQVERAETRIQEIRVTLTETVSPSILSTPVPPVAATAAAAPMEEVVSVVVKGLSLDEKEGGKSDGILQDLELVPSKITDESSSQSLFVEDNTVTDRSLTKSIPPTNTTTVNAENNERNAETVTSPLSTPLLDQLQQNIDNLTQQLENLGLSQAKRYALKKQLAMERSKLLREQRKNGQGS